MLKYPIAPSPQQCASIAPKVRSDEMAQAAYSPLAAQTVHLHSLFCHHCCFHVSWLPMLLCGVADVATVVLLSPPGTCIPFNRHSSCCAPPYYHVVCCSLH
eukprot:6104763-Prorocentrum_lima.AAC.1